MINLLDISVSTAPSIFRATVCEAEISGIQNHLENTNKRSLLANKDWLARLEDSLPFGAFKNINEVKDWIRHLEERSFQSWNEDRIVHEFKHRMEFIRDWMEKD